MHTVTFTMVGKKFIVGEDGSVIDSFTNLPTPVMKLKDRTNRIVLFDGPTPFTLNHGLFLLYVFGKFSLPVDLWESVDVKFLDGNRDNYTLSNLYLDYKEPIPVDDSLTWYYVPGDEGMCITRAGEVLRIADKEVGKRFIDNKGYVNSTLLKASLHRSLALTFKSPPDGYPNLVVDHVDGNKENIELSNLEWVTYRENLIRSFKEGQRTDNKVVLVLDTKTGEVTEHHSSNEAARFIGVHQGSVSNAFVSGHQTVLKRYKVRYSNDGKSWDDIVITPKGNAECVAVKARDVLTGEVTSYPNVRQACLKCGVFPVSVFKQINTGSSEKRITGGYEFKRSDDNSPWTEFNKYDIEVFKRGLDVRTRVYLVKNIVTNEEKIHYGHQSISEEIGVVKRTIIIAAANKTLVSKKYLISMLN